MIYETAVYDGASKEWRGLNLNSGTVYAGSHSNEGDALAEIEDGQERAGHIVRRISLFEIKRILDEHQAKAVENELGALGMRKAERLRKDDYLLDDPDGSGKTESDREWIQLFEEENQLLKRKLNSSGHR